MYYTLYIQSESGLTSNVPFKWLTLVSKKLSDVQSNNSLYTMTIPYIKMNNHISKFNLIKIHFEAVIHKENYTQRTEKHSLNTNIW